MSASARTPLLARRSRSALTRGVTLIELLVAVVVGSALVIAITTILMRSESGRRGLTATNDSSQNAAFVSFTLDRTLRSAGSGFSQAWRQGFGCRVLAARNGTRVLPRATSFPAPFASVPQTLRLAPLLVHAGAGTGGSDVLAVATGASGLGEAPLAVLAGSVTGTQLRVPSTVGLQAKDLVLVLQDANNCMVQQVVDGFVGGASQTLDFGGTYASSTIDSVQLDSLGANSPAFVAPLGNTLGKTPALQLLGVAANATLVSYDLLRVDGSDTVNPIADSVVDLRALYGVDSDGDGRIDTWASPATAPFTAAGLTDGSAQAQRNLASIHAVRVGLVMRSATPERTAVSPATLALFGDLPTALQYSRTLTSAEQLLRHRTVEFTVPLRNVMMAPPHMKTPPPHPGSRSAGKQRGVTLLFGLIALAIMMIGAAAMVRSMNTSMVMSGNLGFKRDLTNQAERATAAVMTLMNTGALSTDVSRQSSATAHNYSATLLPTNAQGIPNALVTEADFNTTGVAGNDITVANQGVVLRYVVDRLCFKEEPADGSHCQMSDMGAPMGGSASVTHRADDSAALGGGGVLPLQTVYRLSIRVSGPRNTQAFFQTTFTL